MNAPASKKKKKGVGKKPKKRYFRICCEFFTMTYFIHVSMHGRSKFDMEVEKIKNGAIPVDIVHWRIKQKLQFVCEFRIVFCNLRQKHHFFTSTYVTSLD